MSNAVGTERISKVVGYQITKGNFSNVTPNLPQRIAVLAEANNANQATLDLTPTEITSAQQAGTLYGFGSPIYQIMRILKPIYGNGVGGIPIIVFPQAEAGGAINKIWRITPSGTATDNTTHTIVIGGRTNVDGQTYNINIVSGDTATIINGKIMDAVNACVGCPVSAANYSYDVDLTSKWKGKTANDITVSVDTNGNSVGITYTIVSAQTASGIPSIQAALNLFANDWNTIIVNSYGTDNTTMDLLETFNGIPDPENPTGRYSGIIMKPFIAITGSVADNDSTLTDAHKLDVTIAIAPAPLSKGLPMEAAANMAVLFALQAQNSPHLDVSGQLYPDMPTPDSIGTMGIYDNRDAYVKKGNSTVQLISGQYSVCDFVTTYHPVGEIPPQFRYCRNLNIDWNMAFGWYLITIANIIDHAIANNDDQVTATKIVKPKIVIQLAQKYADAQTQRSLITDAAFMQDSVTATIDTTNPDRINVFYRYKRSGFGRIVSTVAEAGFNFGTL